MEAVETEENVVNSEQDIDEEGIEEEIYQDSNNPDSTNTFGEDENERKIRKRKKRVKCPRYSDTSSSDLKAGMIFRDKKQLKGTC